MPTSSADIIRGTADMLILKLLDVERGLFAYSHEQVGVSGQELRRRVHDHVGAECELADERRAALVVEGDPRLRAMALFDAVANNADRKVGHLLPMSDGHIYGVDHGICFHVEPKLRTVLWRWRGERLGETELTELRRLRRTLLGPLGEELCGLIATDEVAATLRRVDGLLAEGSFPHPDPDRPAIPWPPY